MWDKGCSPLIVTEAQRIFLVVHAGVAAVEAESILSEGTYPFRDRTEAGRLLAKKLRQYADWSDVVVLALPRGGVPVGFEVAKELNAPLDVGQLVRER
jgi:hypothetical protein